MLLRNGEHGYGAVTKSLHWLTVALVVAQFTVGYLMDDDGGHGRGRGRGQGSGRGRGRGGEEDVIALLPLHVTLGILILVVAILRVAWRVGTPLPPWSERLSHTQRTIAHWTERTLLAALFVVPLTGLVLVLGEDDDLLPVHVAAHVVFFAALAAHLALVVSRRLVGRMLPGRQ